MKAEIAGEMEEPARVGEEVREDCERLAGLLSVYRSDEQDDEERLPARLNTLRCEREACGSKKMSLRRASTLRGKRKSERKQEREDLHNLVRD